MRYIFQRLSFGLSPAWWFVILLVGLVIGATFWVGPMRPLPPDLRLVALQRDGTFTDSVQPPLMRAGDAARFPLVLGAQNVGYAAARPTVVDLSVPLTFRLLDPDGEPLPRETVPGTPLGRYRLGLSASSLVPGGVPEVLLDTLWLEPDIPTYTCVVLSDGVPDFAPRPEVAPSLLSQVDIFYSFETPDSDARQAGLMRVRVDSTVLRVPPGTMGEPGEPVLEEPATGLPPLDALYQVAITDATCGDPQQPVELQSVVYVDDAGGRFIVLYLDGAPRKYLIDQDADSIIEREVWDPDGDGAFEATRTMRYAIPAFLFPRPEPELPRLVGDTTPADPAFLALYADTLRGPFRFHEARQAVGDSAAAMGARDTAAAVAAAPIPADAPVAGDTTPPDPAWLQLYADTAAGPFRFAQRQQQVADSLAAAIARGDTAQQDTTPTPPRRTGPRILGTPVEYPPGSRPPPD